MALYHGPLPKIKVENMIANIEEIYQRLVRASVLLQVVYSAYLSGIPQEHDALAGVCDLLKDICTDFKADLELEEYETGGEFDERKS